jgi:FixJ family two-component response regulator
MQIGGLSVVSHHQIMLLDDDEDMLQLLKLALEHRGLRTCCFSDPSEFFTALRSARPAVVITDLHLDKFDGLEVCRRMTQEHPQVALVVLSGDGTQQTSALSGGADLFLTKPIQAQALGDAVVRLLTPANGEAREHERGR